MSDNPVMAGEYDEQLEQALLSVLEDAIVAIRFNLRRGDAESSEQIADAIHNIPKWIANRDMEQAQWVLPGLDDVFPQWAEMIRNRESGS
ncbi:MAG: hypothetical protein RIB60_09985 [Phycisphaerales bacterium]